jgi:hypothetical protein
VGIGHCDYGTFSKLFRTGCFFFFFLFFFDMSAQEGGGGIRTSNLCFMRRGL